MDAMTREQRLAGIRERATEQMRNIYRSSGHNFSDADIEKLTKDAEWEVEMWAKFADSESERALLEAAKRFCHFCQSGDVPVLIPQSGAWLHSDSFQENSENGSWPFRCKAAAIHDLRSKGESR